MEFINEQIDVEGLPDYAKVQTEKLAKDYLKVILIVRGLVSFLFIAGIIVAAILMKDIPIMLRWISTSIVILIFVWYFAMSRRTYYSRSYAVRQKDILYKKGLLFRSTTVIPFNRIQHLEVVSGPVDRFYDLASLKIYTAGGVQSDLSIPGLINSDASRLKSFILSKTAHDEEE